jgi:hypothetical protein
MNLEIIVLVTVYSHFHHPSLAAEVLHMLDSLGLGFRYPQIWGPEMRVKLCS